MDSQETNIYNAILITAAVLGTIIIYFVISIVRQQRRNLELHRLNILAEINTLEKERTRIAADLHDELGPILSAIKFKINSVDAADEEDQYQLEKASAHIDDLITRLRQIAANLMPNTLVRKGLVAALEEFFNNTAQFSTHITFTHGKLPEISPEKSVNIYRIVQEIVHNTVKHAKAKELLIDLSVRNNMLVLSAKDNGVGFDYQQRLKENSGLGLRNLKSRAEIMGGTVTIESRPMKGTLSIFEIPLN
jgi:two-component system, NarL family, sensor kinase